MRNEVQKKGREELCYCQLRLMIVEMDQTFIWQSKLVVRETWRKGRGLSQTQMQGWEEKRGEFHQ